MISRETEKKAAGWSAAFLALISAVMTFEIGGAVFNSGNLNGLWGLLLPAAILAIAVALHRYSLMEGEE